MSGSITIESLKALFDSLPKPPQFFVGPDTDMALLGQILGVPIVKPRSAGITTSTGFPMIGKDVQVDPYLPKDWLMIVDPPENRVTFLNLLTRSGYRMKYEN
jgi:hypothetical protein